MGSRGSASRCLRAIAPFCLTLLAAGAAAAQAMPDWSHWRAVTITDAEHSGPLLEHQVEVVLVAPAFDFSLAAADGGDIRFTDTDRATLLPYWIESWEPAAGRAVLWVQVPEVPLDGARTVYLYYGNPDAESVSDGAATFEFFDSFEHFTGACALNAPDYLETPTYEGSGQAVHPDVVHVPGGWQGYEYWMAMTPYPDGISAYENPSVLASADGFTWVVPAGLVNPLVPRPADHNADADLLLVGDTLLLYYVEYAGGATDSTHVRLLASTDGVLWTPPITVFSSAGSEGYVLSPTVVHEAGTFTMWYVQSGGCASQSSEIFRRTSADGLAWSDPEPVSVPHPGRVKWHIDVQPDGSRYTMLMPSYPEGKTCGATRLYFAESADGLDWTVAPAPVLKPCAGGWDGAQIYRSTLLVAGDHLRIWYSARGGGAWHIGYTEGQLGDFLSAGEPWDRLEGELTATAEHPHSGEFGLRQTGGTVLPHASVAMAGQVCATVWLYDDLSTTADLMALLRGSDGVTGTVGVGFWTQVSTYRYVWHAMGPAYQLSALPRGAGWHELSLRVYTGVGDSARCELFLDEGLLGTSTELNEQNMSLVLQGRRAGTAWFDDCYVRRLAETDPGVTVGSQHPNGLDSAALNLLPVQCGPVPCGGTAVLTGTYTPATSTVPARSYSLTLQVDDHVAFAAGDVTVVTVPAGADTYHEVRNVPGGGVTIDYLILDPEESITQPADLFTVTVHGVTEGAGLVSLMSVEFRDTNNDLIDCAANDGATVAVDCTGPAPVGDLDAAPGHEHVVVSWVDPEPAGLQGLEIWRALWCDGEGCSAYPEYDDAPGQVIPVRPADRAGAAASPQWEFAGTVAPGCERFVDLVAGRGVYFYEVFALDLAGNPSPPAPSGTAATSYRLGDVAAAGPPYDGVVSIPDVTYLGSVYGLAADDPGWDPEVDYGPTDDGSGTGIPLTDGAVDLEDLMIVALNFGWSEAVPRARPAGDAAVHLAWRVVSPTLRVLSLIEPCARLLGLHLRLTLPPGVEADVLAGTLLEGRPEVILLRGPGPAVLDLALAVLGGGLEETGELLRIVTTAPLPDDFPVITARDRANRELAIIRAAGPPPPPDRFTLEQNRPNPFNPRTTIAFALPAATAVRLGVYTARGRRVRTLVDDRLPAGHHTVAWDGRDDSKRAAASGVYFYRIEAGPLRETRKMLLVR